jgi:hypothetical protein
MPSGRQLVEGSQTGKEKKRADAGSCLLASHARRRRRRQWGWRTSPASSVLTTTGASRCHELRGRCGAAHLHGGVLQACVLLKRARSSCLRHALLSPLGMHFNAHVSVGEERTFFYTKSIEILI